MINVLIADDQNFVRKTLESYLTPELDLNIIGFAENGQVAIEQVANLNPDVVLMDIEMPVMDGLAATKTIAEKFKDTKVLMLSIHDREQDIALALKLGAKGYWLKNTSPQELADAIRHVHKGYFQLALELVEKHFARTTIPNSVSKQDLELSHKLNMVDTVLAQIEQKIDSLEELTPSSLHETIESIVKHEMAVKRERDANLQFKFDRLKHKFERLEQKMNLATRVQLIGNLAVVSAVLLLSYLVFIN
ncbi:MAG: response regulator transcription factor [Pleurocapsa sp.]